MTSDAQKSRLLHLRHLGDIITQLLGPDLVGTVTVTDYSKGHIKLHVSAGNEPLVRENTSRLIRQLRQRGLEAVTTISLVPPLAPPASYRVGPGPGRLLNGSGKVHTNRKERAKNPDEDEGKGDGGEERVITVAELLELAGKREHLTAVVKGLLDERVSEHIVGTDYHADDGELVILCESPAWATQLRFLQRTLIPTLATKGMSIRTVAVRVMPAREERPPPPSAPAAPMSKEAAAVIEGIAAHTSHPGLSAALLRLTKHCRPGT